MQMCQTRAKCAYKKKQVHMVRKVPKYKCKTNAQVIDAPEAKDSGTVFGSKFWPRPGGEPENRLAASKGRYTCTEKAGYINSAPLYICRVVLFLLRQRRGAGLVFWQHRGAGLGELQRARGRSECFATAPAHTSRALYGSKPKVQSLRGRRNNLISRSGNMRALPAFPCSRAKLPHGVSYISLLRALFSRVLPTSKLLFRARLYTCRRASTDVIWVPS